ncbi:MAG TPA: ABC transporter permease [Chloroflexota bacterium]
MSNYVVRRMGLAVPVLLLVSVLVFTIIRIIPGDVVTMKMAEGGEGADAAAMRHQLGLDQPLPVQYIMWLGQAVRGDLGNSLWTRRPVTQEIATALPISLELAILAMVIAIAIAIPAGLVSAVASGTPADHLVRLVSVAGLAIPPFWLGTLFIMLPAVFIGWAPPAGYSAPWEDLSTNLQQFILPALALGYFYSALSMRLTRSQALDVLRQDYVRTARAKGLADQMVVVRHVLKNTLMPVITLAGAQLGVLLGGVVIIEQIFSLPGMGRLTLWAISVRDYPQLQANVLLIAATTVFLNLFVDLAYAWLDPRVRSGR